MGYKCVVKLSKQYGETDLSLSVIRFDESWEGWTADRCMRAINSLNEMSHDVFSLEKGNRWQLYTPKCVSKHDNEEMTSLLNKHTIPVNLIPGKKPLGSWYYPHNFHMQVKTENLANIRSFFEYFEVKIIDLSHLNDPALMPQFFKIFQGEQQLALKPQALYLNLNEHTQDMIKALSLQKEMLAGIQHLAFNRYVLKQSDLNNMQQVMLNVCQNLPGVQTLEMPASRLHVLDASIGKALSELRVVVTNFELEDIWALRRDILPHDIMMSSRENCYCHLKNGYAAVHEHLSQAQIMRVVTAEGIPEDLATIMHQHFATGAIPGLEIAFSDQCARYVEEQKNQPKPAQRQGISIKMFVKRAIDQELSWPGYRQQSVDAFEEKTKQISAQSKAVVMAVLLCFQRKNKGLEVPLTQDASIHILCMCNLLSMGTKAHLDKPSNAAGVSSMRLVRRVQVERLVEKPSYIKTRHRLRASAAGGADTDIVPTDRRRWRPRTTTYDPGMRWPVTTTYHRYASDSSSESEDAGAAASARGCRRRFEPR